MASSQSGFVYSNLVDNTMSSIYNFDAGNYILELNMKYEFEWDHDALTVFSSCEGCENDTLAVFSDHSWNMNKKNIPFNILENDMKAINLNISTDSDLYYRGFEIDNIDVLYKPSGQCLVGDVVPDGKINVVDIIKIVGMIMDEEFSAFQSCCGDVNEDSLINVTDITFAIEVIIGDYIEN